jgi:hypothetical protein
MLNDFFSINLPYGIRRNDNGEWMAFNRENMPLGFNLKTNKYRIINSLFFDLPIYTKYTNLNEKNLLKLTSGDDSAFELDDKGNIKIIWFYNDTTNPVNQKKDVKLNWEQYFEKLKILSRLRKV